MNRSEIVDKLETVAPALAGNDIIPIMNHYWFTGRELLAYNDKIAIAVPCDIGHSCAVPSQLRDILRHSRAAEVVLTAEENGLLVKAGPAKVRFAVMPPNEFIFEMPAEQGKPALLSGAASIEKFLACIENCLQSIAGDSIVPEHMGVTIEADKDHLYFYSTNDVTMSTAQMRSEAPLKFSKTIILPEAFCKQLLAFSKRKVKISSIGIYDDHALMRMEDGTILFGRLFETDQPIDFVEAIDSAFPEKAAAQVVSIPANLKLILERSIVVTDMETDKMFVTITVKDGVMRFLSKTSRAEIVDTLKIDHPDMPATRFEPRLLRAGIGRFDKMFFSPRCAAMIRGSMQYLVSPSTL